MKFFEFNSLAPWHCVSSRELAEHLGVSIQTLANWRFRGEGPTAEMSLRFSGRSTYYRVAEIEAWERTKRGEPLLAWQVTAQWLRERYLFPKPLETEEQTQRVVEQLERWNIFPPVHKPRGQRTEAA